MEYLAAAAVIFGIAILWLPAAYYLAIKLGTYARLKTERDFKEQERKDDGRS